MEEAALVDEISVFTAESLDDVAAFLNDEGYLQELPHTTSTFYQNSSEIMPNVSNDLSSIT